MKSRGPARCCSQWRSRSRAARVRCWSRAPRRRRPTAWWDEALADRGGRCRWRSPSRGHVLPRPSTPTASRSCSRTAASTISPACAGPKRRRRWCSSCWCGRSRPMVASTPWWPRRAACRPTCCSTWSCAASKPSTRPAACTAEVRVELQVIAGRHAAGATPGEFHRQRVRHRRRESPRVRRRSVRAATNEAVRGVLDEVRARRRRRCTRCRPAARDQAGSSSRRCSSSAPSCSTRSAPAARACRQRRAPPRRPARRRSPVAARPPVPRAAPARAASDSSSTTLIATTMARRLARESRDLGRRQVGTEVVHLEAAARADHRRGEQAQLVALAGQRGEDDGRATRDCDRRLSSISATWRRTTTRPVVPARSRTRRDASGRPLRAAAAAARRARAGAGAAWRSASVRACSQSADRKSLGRLEDALDEGIGGRALPDGPPDRSSSPAECHRRSRLASRPIGWPRSVASRSRRSRSTSSGR